MIYCATNVCLVKCILHAEIPRPGATQLIAQLLHEMSHQITRKLVFKHFHTIYEFNSQILNLIIISISEKLVIYQENLNIKLAPMVVNYLRIASYSSLDVADDKLNCRSHTISYQYS